MPNAELGRSYLPSTTLNEYLHVVAIDHPRLYALLDITRIQSAEALANLLATTNEFDSDQTGRGDSYRRAQRDPSVRWRGASHLLRLATPPDSSGDVTILDVLGGDGTIARAVAEQANRVVAKLTVLTGDISGVMVERALAHGIPAVRQAANSLFLRGDSVDAALLAYGTHHIMPTDRAAAAAEAVRVVRRGGRIVMHDFAESSPMARFFAELVHPWSAAGHDYPHFSRTEFAELFRPLPVTVRVVDVYDPLIVRAASPAAARRRMCEYVGDMYGIRDVLTGQHDGDESWRILEASFDHSTYLSQTRTRPDVPHRPVVHSAPGCYIAEVPRMAITAVAQKAS